MRIVGGRLRGRPLAAPKSQAIRPTADRLREALFNILMHSYDDPVSGARVLDLFAGTGALGLEALSRGARQVTFVEKSAVAARVLRANAEMLDADGAGVLQADAFEFLDSATGEAYDVVFLDPPFATDMLGDLCRLLDEAAVLAGGSLVYLEDDGARPQIEFPPDWSLLKSKTAGNVRYSLAQVDDRD